MTGHALIFCERHAGCGRAQICTRFSTNVFPYVAALRGVTQASIGAALPAQGKGTGMASGDSQLQRVAVHL